jgi:hypothetical protein
VQRAAAVVRGALQSLEASCGRRGARPQLLAQARLADARFAREQQRLALAVAGARQALQQQREFALAADEGRQRAGGPRVEAAGDDALAEHAPGLERRAVTPADPPAARLDVEGACDEAPRLGRDQDLTGFGQPLQPHRETGRLAAGDRLGRAGTGRCLADHDEAGGDADARLQRRPLRRRQRADGLDRRERGAHRPRRVVLVRAGVAEPDHHAVAEQLRDVAVEGGDRRGHRVAVGAEQPAQVLGVEPHRQRGGADQVADHHGEVAALVVVRARVRRQCGHRVEDPPSVRGRHADRLEVGIGEVGQHVEVDALLGEGGREVGRAEGLQPGGEVGHVASRHAAIAASTRAARRRSGYPNPSVNPPYTARSSAAPSAPRPCRSSSVARSVAARSAKIAAPCRRATCSAVR